MDPVKIGIIGCGVISNSHLKLAAASDIADIVAPKPELLQSNESG